MGCYFHLAFSPHNFLSLRFLKDCWPHAQNNCLCASCTGLVHVVCTLLLLVGYCCAWVVKCSAWCIPSLNSRIISNHRYIFITFLIGTHGVYFFGEPSQEYEYFRTT